MGGNHDTSEAAGRLPANVCGVKTQSRVMPIKDARGSCRGGFGLSFAEHGHRDPEPHCPVEGVLRMDLDLHDVPAYKVAPPPMNAFSSNDPSKP